MPCKALKEVKRYAITTLLSFINNRPKIHVRETSKRRVTEQSVQHLSQRKPSRHTQTDVKNIINTYAYVLIVKNVKRFPVCVTSDPGDLT